jgi:hypothetical protein
MAKVQGAIHVRVCHRSEMLRRRGLRIICRSILVKDAAFGPLSLVFLLGLNGVRYIGSPQDFECKLHSR